MGYFFLPQVRFYLQKLPALGIDLFNSATYVNYLANNFAPPFSAWKYIWYAGVPISKDYPMRVFVLRRTGKPGLGKAYIDGFKWALNRDYDFIIEMDALIRPES